MNLFGNISIRNHFGLKSNGRKNWCFWYCLVFDGNGQTICNFIYKSTDADCIGFFGIVDGLDAVIKDLGLIDPNVDAGEKFLVGSLAGFMGNGTITGCYAEGGNISGWGRRHTSWPIDEDKIILLRVDN